MNDDSTVGAAILFGGWALSLFAYGLLIVSAQRNRVRRRVLLAVLVLVCALVASPVLFASQPALDPCRVCAGVEPWTWLWVVSGCWSC